MIKFENDAVTCDCNLLANFAVLVVSNTTIIQCFPQHLLYMEVC